jgi:hypothetical protein
MTPKQFKQLTSLQQVELLFDKGQEVMTRIFIFYNVRLYALSDFFVEVWYRQTTNKIDRIIVLETNDVLDIYDGQIRLDDLIG